MTYKNKLKKGIAAIGVSFVALMTAAQAEAANYYQFDIATWQKVLFAPTQVFDSTPTNPYGSNGTNNTTYQDFSITYPFQADFSALTDYSIHRYALPVAVDLSAYDGIKIFTSNENESPWTYGFRFFNPDLNSVTDTSLFEVVAGPAGVFGIKTVVNGDSQVFTVDFQPGDSKIIQYVQFEFYGQHGVLPGLRSNGTEDTNPEFRIYVATPEPSSIALLGMSLMGIIAAARYNRRK